MPVAHAPQAFFRAARREKRRQGIPPAGVLFLFRMIYAAPIHIGRDRAHLANFLLRAGEIIPVKNQEIRAQPRLQAPCQLLVEARPRRVARVIQQRADPVDRLMLAMRLPVARGGTIIV